MAGLVPAIHVLPRSKKDVDARIRGHDEYGWRYATSASENPATRL
jgi:hypothetical protein